MQRHALILSVQLPLLILLFLCWNRSLNKASTFKLIASSSVPSRASSCSSLTNQVRFLPHCILGYWVTLMVVIHALLTTCNVSYWARDHNSHLNRSNTQCWTFRFQAASKCFFFIMALRRAVNHWKEKYWSKLADMSSKWILIWTIKGSNYGVI